MTALSPTIGHSAAATSAIGKRAWGTEPPRLGMRAYLTCLKGIVWREVWRSLHQR